MRTPKGSRSRKRFLVPGESDRTMYDVLGVPAPAGAVVGETLETAQKETVDRDEETLVIDELVRLGR